MLEIVNELLDKVFTYDNKKYKVLSVEIKNQKAIIVTDRRTFVFLSGELNDFMDKIILLNPPVENVEVMKPAGYQTKELVSDMTVLKAEIIHNNAQARRITDKLEDVFNELSADPKDATYKKAKAMVDASNAIVNMQLANYKFLSLK